MRKCIKYIKYQVDFWIKIIINNRFGQYIQKRFTALIFLKQFEVEHNRTIMHFSIPNWLSNYRARTFSTKEPETLEWIDESITTNSVLWDIGANVGLYSIYASKAKKCKVYAFEPSVFNLELLARNIYLNKLQNQVSIIPLALSNKAGVSKFRMSSTEWGGALSSFDKNIDQNGVEFDNLFEYSIYGISMDEAVKLLRIPSPDVIKMDVDGVEHFILSGGREVLKNVDSVLVEINDSFKEQLDITNKLLTEAGLVLYKKCDCGSPNQFNQWWERKTV